MTTAQCHVLFSDYSRAAHGFEPHIRRHVHVAHAQQEQRLEGRAHGPTQLVTRALYLLRRLARRSTFLEHRENVDR